MKKEGTVIVVGGGLAALSSVIKLAEKGYFIKIFSVTKVKRSHSVCAQGGINAAMNLQGEGDSPYIHAYDTLKGGDFLADQPPVLEMCLAAPAVVRLMDRLGCPFNRTAEGNLDVRRFGGTLYHRTVFCGASTGQQLLYALDEQVRRYEVKGKVEKFENHEFLRLILDSSGRACGIVYMDLINMQLHIMKGDAVIFGTGGPGLIFKKSTNSTFCTGAANGRLFTQGVWYANGEFIQIHPTAIPGEDKLRLISESTRGEGGRVWVFGDSSKSLIGPNGEKKSCGKTGEPWYFLEELYPGYGNLVSRDVASREIFRVCEMGLGIDGKQQVYLDMTHLSKETLHKVDSVLELYQKFTGEDPRKVPMKVFPAMHYSMGGIWVDWPAANDSQRYERFRQMSNIVGCFCVGECEFQYHGANRLGANSLLSCIFGGLMAGAELFRYLENFPPSSIAPPSLFSDALAQEESFKHDLLTRNGTENVHQLHEEMSQCMIKSVAAKRDNSSLKKALDQLKEIRERYQSIQLDDKGTLMNQTYAFANQFRYMIEVSLAIVKSALMRNESRGAHFKEEYPHRDDANFLKTTVASYEKEEPNIFYKEVNIDYLKPTSRDYTRGEKVEPKLENLPPHITLPL